MQIAPNVYLVPDITANPYLLIDADGLTLIDAGLPGAPKKILAYMASLGFAPGDLKRILITHSDFDHVSGLAALKSASGACVYASQIEAAALLTGKPSRTIRPENPLMRMFMGVVGRIAKTSPVQAGEIVTDGQVLPVLGGLTVLETPGHTPGHLSFYASAIGVLFCGDSLVVEKDGSLQSSRPGLTWDREAATASLRRQAALGAKIVCSGHGPVATGVTPDKFPQT
jgi:glyoxylase-like metal-dependent hydrolase (beta-lactamase superfamily II)